MDLVDDFIYFGEPCRFFNSSYLRNKGQKIYADSVGRASTNVEIASSDKQFSELQIERAQVERFVGIALEDNADEDEKLVECILKV